MAEEPGSAQQKISEPGFEISEDTDILSHVVRELGLLKDEPEDEPAPKLYTGPYGRILSPFKKQSSFQRCAGVKRSPRKLALPAAKRTKLFRSPETEDSSGEDNSPDIPLSGETSQANESEVKMDNDETVSDEESSEEDKWEIIEEDNDEIDQRLEDKSHKFSLSALNVKSIIHKIITNENVVEMVRKAVLEEIEENDIRYEPKLTRSKLKELEAQGKVPTNWGLSPRKKKRESPNFLEMELPEDEEDDEDFNPEKVVQESDEDSESVISSGISDLGSPMPSTPRSCPATPSTVSTPKSLTVTPKSGSDIDTTLTSESNISPTFTSPMGPPLQTCVPRSHLKGSALGRKFLDAMYEDSRKSEQEEEEELIARRTRSKFPMTDMSILDIEANFVAPDITQDLYDTECDDTDWKEFLCQIHAPDVTLTSCLLNVTNDDEDTEDDPEYNYQAEFEAQELDTEDFRDDRAVKVSKKEVNELLDDILNNDAEDDCIDETCKLKIKTQSEKILMSSNKKKRTEYQQNLIAEIGEYERRQIDDQLRKHVQQLAQTYVMAQSDKEEHGQIADTAQFLLQELESFARRFETCFGKSAVRVCNLAPAVALLDTETWKAEDEFTQEERDRMDALTFKYDSQNLPPLSYRQMHVMWTSPVFMFPELLPHGGFFRRSEIKTDRARVKFLESEDNLLAMGMSQFRHLKKDAKDLINRFMLPCKTRKQIEIRIKNLSAKATKDNAVKFYRTYKQLPRFPQHAPEFHPSMMKSLQDSQYSWHELPMWCKFFGSDVLLLNESAKDQLARQRELKRRRKARQSASFSLSGDNISALLTPPSVASASAPVTPYDSVENTIPDCSSSSTDSPEFTRPVKKRRARRQSRKRLDLSKGLAPGKDLLQTFVPLPIAGGPLIVIDSLQGASALPQVLNPGPGQTSSSSLFTSSAQTIFVINRSAPVTVQSVCSNISLTAAAGGSGTQTVTCMSSSLPVTSVTMTGNPENTADVIDGTKLTFEEICRPIMEAELAAGNVLPNRSCNRDVSEKDYALALKPETNIAVSDVLRSAIVSTSSVIAAPVVHVPNIANVTKELSRTKSENSFVFCDVQSNEVSSTNPKDSIFQDVATSPIPTVNAEGDTKHISMPSFEELSGEVTPTIPTSESSNQVLLEKSVSPLMESNQTTPPQKSSFTSSEQSPKSAVELVASLAPFFISPVKDSAVVSQQVSETTPTKSMLPKLAPKSTSPREERTEISFDDLSSSRRKPKRKLSPRKLQLQKQVRTILPKGFVMSTYDTSPAKKAASNLLDKAKLTASQSKGYCAIMPWPPNLPRQSTTELYKKSRSYKRSRVTLGASNKGADSQEDDHIEISCDNDTDGGKENRNNSARVANDGGGYKDSESDYTQSEDEHETQGTDGDDMDMQGTDDGEVTLGTDGDSQDSQEEDDTLTAETDTPVVTPSLVPAKEDLQARISRKDLGRKDRDRDLMLSLLAADIVESDPQRDLRDTLFAQSFMHRVKKVFRYDVDRLEKFLTIMYHFGTEGTSPIKLYKDVEDIFSDHPDLMHDFAGFLTPEQAVKCGCYKANQEFSQARTFLRKLEIYFGKNPNQLQKVMRTFSRWHKKPGRKESDLREQIEPMLKGTRFLLDEFLRFFPNERPSESLMDDFEEINLDGSGENDKDSSFEEIELLDIEEVYGTKRCTCVCHETGDDTYKKRKKHCYKCCLTVIDGELVYKINKSTIKKINVTVGPPVKASELRAQNQTSVKQESVLKETVNEYLNQIRNNEIVPDTETPVTAGHADQIPAVVTDHKVLAYREPENTDWLMDEKENIEHFSDGKMTSKTNSPSRECYTEMTSDLAEKPEGLVSVLEGKSSQFTSEQGRQLQPNLELLGNLYDKGQEYERMEYQESKFKLNGTETTNEYSEMLIAVPLSTVSSDNFTESSVSVSVNVQSKPQCSSENIEGTLIQNTNEAEADQRLVVPINTKETEICPQRQVAQEKSKTFSAVVSSEISTGTSKLFSAVADEASGSTIESRDALQKDDIIISGDIMLEPKVVKSVLVVSTGISVPVGQNSLNVSADSSFVSINSSENLELHKAIETDRSACKETLKTMSDTCGRIGESIPAITGNKELKLDSILEPSKSPPFSPFAQEIQNITSVQSPLASVQSPVFNRSLSSSSKVRRITPIPVKGEEAIADSPVTFKAALECAPVLTDMPMIQSPVAVSQANQSNSRGEVLALSDTVENKEQRASPITSFSQAVLKTSTDSGSSSSNPVLSNSSTVDSIKADVEVKISDSGDTLCSQTSSGSAGLIPSISIGQPEIFSEDANVSFPKSSSGSNLANTAILSEESLFQCLTKPPQFGENLPTVSNLTNILQALGGNSQTMKTSSSNKALEAAKCSDTVTGPMSDLIDKSSNFEVAKKTVLSSNSNDHGLQDSAVLFGSSSSSEGTSGENGEQKGNMYHPQSVESIENLERLQSGLFKVGRLSDSDASITTTPSTSAVNVSSTRQEGRQNTDNMDIAAPSEVTYYPGENENSAIYDHCKLSGNDTQIKGSAIVSKTTNVTAAPTERRHEPEKKKRHKMSRRELRKSLQCKDMTGLGPDSDPSVTVTEEEDEDDKDSIQKEIQVAGQAEGDLRLGVMGSNSGAEHSATISSQFIESENVHESTTAADTLTKIKIEDNLEDAELDNVRTSDVQSVSDSVSETSSRGRRKSKHKKHKSKHKRKKRGEHDSDRKKKKRRRNKDVADEDADMSSELSAHDTDNAESEKAKNVQNPESSKKNVSHEASPSSVSAAMGTEAEPVPEPEWSKETDKTILEMCKVHGIKEKTFVKIARQLGTVTAQQVHRRFAYLYKMIFGISLGEKMDQ